MKALRTFMMCILVSACGANVPETKIKEVCSSDSPAIVMPDEVVCNHSPADAVQVTGKEVVYICTKIQGGNNE